MDEVGDTVRAYKRYASRDVRRPSVPNRGRAHGDVPIILNYTIADELAARYFVVVEVAQKRYIDAVMRITPTWRYYVHTERRLMHWIKRVIAGA
jgi:hypothetical protein